jgi:hypothetical protein
MIGFTDRRRFVKCIVLERPECNQWVGADPRGSGKPEVLQRGVLPDLKKLKVTGATRYAIQQHSIPMPLKRRNA